MDIMKIMGIALAAGTATIFILMEHARFKLLLKGEKSSKLNPQHTAMTSMPIRISAMVARRVMFSMMMVHARKSLNQNQKLTQIVMNGMQMETVLAVLITTI